MQHKRGKSKAKALFVALVVVTAGSIGLLMTAGVPAPTHLIEKPLDAKSFLEQKQ